MNKQDLQKLGLTVEGLKDISAEKLEKILDKAVVSHGKDIEKFKTQIAGKDKEIESRDERLEKASESIELFKEMKPEELKKAADAYKAEAKENAKAASEALKASEQKLKDLRYDHKLESELSDANVRDPKDIIPHLSKDTMVIGEDGKFVGLSEQLDVLREKKDYLFSDTKETPKVVLGGDNHKVTGDAVIDAARAAAGVSSKD